MRPLCSALLSLLLAGCAGGAATQTASGPASCLGRKLGELPMVRSPTGYFVVPVYFGEHPRGMIVDTGAESNVLFRPTLAEEGLHETGNYQYSILSEGLTGVQRNGIASMPLLKFAGIPLEGVTMGVVGVDPPKFDLLPIAGLLGTPYLSIFDIEMDVPGETLSLYGRARCEAIEPPWRQPYSTVPMTAIATNLQQRSQDIEGHSTISQHGLGEANRARLLVPVAVNGHPERALLDTGATTSMPPATAEGVGLVASADPQKATTRGVDGGQADGDIRRAAELRFGDEVLRDKAVGVFPFRNVEADMILGREVFRGKRVFISFAQKKLFIQSSDSKP